MTFLEHITHHHMGRAVTSQEGLIDYEIDVEDIHDAVRYEQEYRLNLRISCAVRVGCDTEVELELHKEDMHRRLHHDLYGCYVKRLEKLACEFRQSINHYDDPRMNELEDIIDELRGDYSEIL